MAEYKLIEIKLTPVTPYFFGKEPFQQLGNKSDYFQTSWDFPQQTTLLGMLRHKVLRDNGIDLNILNPKNTNGLNINDLIGEKSFEVKNNCKNSFGKIHSISPCYIVNDKDEKLFFENCESIDGQLLTLNESKDAFQSGGKPFINKKFFDNKIGSVKTKDCIHDTAKVGIYKGGVKTVSTAKSYFIMEFKHLGTKQPIDNKDLFSKFTKWSFGFHALVEKDLEIKECRDFMEMGKEKSLFKVEAKITNPKIEIVENSFYDYCLLGSESLNSEVIKCVLLSDTKVSQENLSKLKSQCVFMVTNKQRFRYIKRNTKHYYLGEKPMKETKAFNLIAKGSVLFLEKSKISEVSNILNEAQDFKQIGYNYFHFKNI